MAVVTVCRFYQFWIYIFSKWPGFELKNALSYPTTQMGHMFKMKFKQGLPSSFASLLEVCRDLEGEHRPLDEVCRAFVRKTVFRCGGDDHMARGKRQ